MRGAFAAPVAKAISVSEVEVSPSMVTALKLSATPSLSSLRSTGGVIGASAAMEPSSSSPISTAFAG
ncbi:hypothetical protein D3C83_153050 [compost metagenome]